MAIDQNDVIEVSARMEFDGTDDVTNVYQFQKLDSGQITDQQGIDDIIALLETMWAIIDGAITVLQVARDLKFFNKTKQLLMGTASWDTITGGTNASGATPPGTAMLLSLNTNVPRVTMRKYMGVVSKDQLESDGTWAAALIAALATFGAYLTQPWTGTNGQWQFGYLSPKTFSFVIPSGLTVTDIPAYQRRRKQGQGS